MLFRSPPTPSSPAPPTPPPPPSSLPPPQPSCLDGRAPAAGWTLADRVPLPDVVLASYEAFAADAEELRAITWEAVVLGELGGGGRCWASLGEWGGGVAIGWAGRRGC